MSVQEDTALQRHCKQCGVRIKAIHWPEGAIKDLIIIANTRCLLNARLCSKLFLFLEQLYKQVNA
jgi:hypothetical protein